MWCVPRLNAKTVTILTVRDPVSSASWYQRVLGFTKTGQYPSEEPHQVSLSRPEVNLELCLVRHADSSDKRFDERRIGLDHLEFLVDTAAELESWQRHFDDLGIEHSGIKKPSWSSSHLLTFRDPDGIQLELYWPSRGVGT
jgi:glyoxylase I family protein